MQNETHCSSLPPNAFTPEFLQALEAREDAPLAALEVASRGSDLAVGARREGPRPKDSRSAASR